MSDGENSSSDALGAALRDAAGVETQFEAALRHDREDARNRKSKHWRFRKRLNLQREKRLATRAVARIQGRLGRRSHRQVIPGRRQRREVVSSDTLLDLAFGDEARPADSLPSAAVAGARTGYSKEMARRARSIVLNCLQTCLDDRMAKSWACVSEGGTHPVEPVGLKFQWDETALRMYLPLETVERLFPFHFEEAVAAGEAEPGRPRKGSGTRPSYTVQIMQSQGTVMLGEHAGTLFVPAKIVHSTSASDLSLPIQLFLPVSQLQALPLDRDVLLILNGDSFKPNKLIIHHLAEQVGHPTHDGLCFGRRLFSPFIIIHQSSHS